VTREVDGDGLDLELACDVDWQRPPGIEIGAGLMEQEREIRSTAPAEPAHYRSPGKIPFDRLRAECRPVA
jgi:hypothetical protein